MPKKRGTLKALSPNFTSTKLSALTTTLSCPDPSSWSDQRRPPRKTSPVLPEFLNKTSDKHRFLFYQRTQKLNGSDENIIIIIIIIIITCRKWGTRAWLNAGVDTERPTAGHNQTIATAGLLVGDCQARLFERTKYKIIQKRKRQWRLADPFADTSTLAVANRLRRRTSDQTVLGSNPGVAAALSPWTRLFTPIVPRRSLHISFY